MNIEKLKSCLKYTTVPNVMLLLTVFNFVLFTTVMYGRIDSWINYNCCPKGDPQSPYELLLKHYQYTIEFILIMFLGWLVYTRFPRIGALIEAIPFILIGILISWILLDNIF